MLLRYQIGLKKAPLIVAGEYDHLLQNKIDYDCNAMYFKTDSCFPECHGLKFGIPVSDNNYSLEGFHNDKDISGKTYSQAHPKYNLIRAITITPYLGYMGTQPW